MPALALLRDTPARVLNRSRSQLQRLALLDVVRPARSSL